ncbi:MAG TPA: hypothetical protein VL793_03960 [Patescibacteria group bacterium]|nr:hypothetical protein [Patescibacteria group bacterium]
MESSGTGTSPVKGMIRNRETEQFYKGEGKWTSDNREAMQFETLTQVVSEAQRFGLKGACEYVVEVGGQIGFRVLLAL